MWALATYSSSACSMPTPSFCVVNLTSFDPFIGCLLYILGFISLWWWTTFVCWLAIHIAFKKVCSDSYHLFCLSFLSSNSKYTSLCNLDDFYKMHLLEIFSFNLWLTILFANNWAKYFHVVMMFSVSFASVSVPFPPSLYLINCLSKGHSDFVLYFSSVNVLRLGFTFKSLTFSHSSLYMVWNITCLSLCSQIST